MQLSKQEFDKMSKRASKKSRSWVNIPSAFVIGGLICCLGQLILNTLKSQGLNDKNAALLTSISLVFLSALFTGLRLYEKIAKHGGAGTLVPITGFANAVVSPAIEFKIEGFILGVGAKIFAIAGPVILYGTAASVLYGIIYYYISA
ncbi:MAG: stage V sporulation protein AC [Oscillospiraceae bacterium]